MNTHSKHQSFQEIDLLPEFHTSPTAISSKPQQSLVKAKVLIIEEFPILEEGIMHTLKAEKDLVLYGKVTRGNELAVIADRNPDAVILNITNANRLDLLLTITTRWPGLAVLAHAASDDLTYAERAVLAGAKGYVAMSESATKMASTLRHILRGELSLPEKVEQKMMLLGINGKFLFDGPPNALLSKRELLVYRLRGNGLSTRQIAKQLRVSVKTIDTHYAHIKAKLHLKNGPDLLRAAVTWVVTTPNGQQSKAA